ncbi:hypothetical protein K466DRAFT_660376 [Polyporus arcularius HHB13444]|uniref:Replication protein A C-terminal domain-containing protein n=1 Tax=Polyporus arcularius HHB13444 TaxID=1314778 RepID=A0A5C3PNY8_9APHY|nr:hypothetical protein K466DRAFT_660376 [Polyporus arcularius HHB13444]
MTSHDDSLADVEIEQLQDLASSSATGIRPVTIRQLLSASRPYSDAKFSIGEIAIDRVSTVAQVMDVQGRPSSITYVLEDGTGSRMSARQWRSDGGETLREGHSGYVQVVGHLDTKTQSGSNNVLIVKSIRALDDPADRLFFHLMQAAFVTLCFERGPPPTSVLVQATPRFASSEAQEPCLPRSVPPTPQRAAGTGAGVACTDTDPTTPASPSRSDQKARRRPTSPEPSLAAVRPQSVEPSQHVQSATADVASRAVSPSPPIRPRAPAASGPSPPQTPRRDMRAQGSSGGAGRRQSGIKRDPYAHLTVLQRAILLQILNTQYAEGGSDVFTISRGVAHHNPTAEQIGDELDFLVNEGFIETTIDTGHYAIRTSHYPTSP